MKILFISLQNQETLIKWILVNRKMCTQEQILTKPKGVNLLRKLFYKIDVIVSGKISAKILLMTWKKIGLQTWFGNVWLQYWGLFGETEDLNITHVHFTYFTSKCAVFCFKSSLICCWCRILKLYQNNDVCDTKSKYLNFSFQMNSRPDG